MKTKISLSDPELRFDPEKHQYWIGKKRIPGVSEILKTLGLSKNYDGIDPFYRDRGIATHKAIELYLKGILDPETIDDVVKPHFKAFLNYWGGRKEVIVCQEKPMHYQEEFAGTPDLVTEAAIYDWKCSKAHDPVAELQGQAYKLMQGGNLPFIVVELRDDGSFKEFAYGYSRSEWVSVMSLYRWKKSLC